MPSRPDYYYITARDRPENYQKLNNDIPEYEPFLGKIVPMHMDSTIYKPYSLAYHDGDRTPRLVTDIVFYLDKNRFIIEIDDKEE